MEIVYWKKNWT